MRLVIGPLRNVQADEAEFCKMSYGGCRITGLEQGIGPVMVLGGPKSHSGPPIPLVPLSIRFFVTHIDISIVQYTM